MEIVTYVLDGALAHKDSMGNGSVIRPGEVQYMAAGTGVRHSEYNASRTEPVHLLQIWLLPNQTGVEPRYAQEAFPPAAKRNRLALLVSPDGRDGSIATHQDALLYGALPDDGATVSHQLADDRQGYVHVARGRVRLNASALPRSAVPVLPRQPRQSRWSRICTCPRFALWASVLPEDVRRKVLLKNAVRVFRPD